VASPGESTAASPEIGRRRAVQNRVVPSRVVPSRVVPSRAGQNRAGQNRAGQNRGDQNWGGQKSADQRPGGRADPGSVAASSGAIRAGSSLAASASRTAATSSPPAANRSSARPVDRSASRARPTAYRRLIRSARPSRHRREMARARAPGRWPNPPAGRPVASPPWAADPRSTPRRPSSAGSSGRPDPCTNRALFRSLVAFRSRRCRMQRDQDYRLQSRGPVPDCAGDSVPLAPAARAAWLATLCRLRWRREPPT
jgi:hypothetical protein